MTALLCPKCRADMRRYERNGVHVDQCTECRGLFLDRGELEALIAAETGWHSAGVPAHAPPRRDDSYGRRYDDSDDRRRYDSAPYGRRKKRRSFLEDLFD